jgi:hypothetical protein
MADLDRVKRNVSRMVSLNAPETDIDAYIASEGATLDQVRAHKATPKPAGPGIVASSLEGVGQGLSFGFLDEAEGAARAGINKIKGDQRSFGELYDEGVAVPRSRIAAAKEANPVAFTVGELGAGVAVPGGLARLGVRGALARSSGAGLGTRTMAGAKEGAAYGAAYGAGTAEGGLEERAKGLGTGAVTGAAVGSLVPGAVDAIGAVGTRLAAPFRAMANPQGVAAEKLGEAIARDFPQGGAGRFAAKFDDMAAANPSARMMDAGGENVRGLMRSANNMPNEARDTARRTIDARQANQSTRIEGELSKGFGQGRNYYDSIDDLSEKMSEIGSKAIQPALQKETPMTPELRRLLAHPSFQKIQKDVENKLALEGKNVGPNKLFDDFEPGTHAVDLPDGDRQVYYEMWKSARNPPPAPERLSEFVRRYGGLKDKGGDVKSFTGGQSGKLVRGDKGKSEDDVALAAWEHGFFPRGPSVGNRPTIQEFHELLERDLRGDPVVRAASMPELEARETSMKMLDDLRQMGVTATTEREARRQLGMAPAKEPLQGHPTT